MKSTRRWYYCLWTTLTVVGAMACGEGSRELTGPEGPVLSVGPSLETPLPPGIRLISDEYIVVLSDAAPPAGRAIGALLTVHRDSVISVWEAALKGFWARLTPATVEALRRNPWVKSIEHNQIGRLDRQLKTLG